MTTPKHKPQPEDIPVGIDVWLAGNVSLSIPVAGLLADQPQLRTEQHTEADWQQLLAAYGDSLRP